MKTSPGVISKNFVQIRNISSQSCMTDCLNTYPIKILNPRHLNDRCYLVLSNYGGGIVEGDRYHLEIQLEKLSKCYVTTQSYSKVFKNDFGQISSQTMEFSLKENSSMIYYSDPIIPQAKSRFEQGIKILKHIDSSLIYIDTIYPGRFYLNELFEYDRYSSVVEIIEGGDLVFKDALSITPQFQDIYSALLFESYKIMTNILVFDMEAHLLVKSLMNKWNLIEREKLFGSFIRIHDKAYLVRILSSSPEIFLNIIQPDIFSELVQMKHLSVNPLSRKF